jgi:biotin carboxyl carrier protein
MRPLGQVLIRGEMGMKLKITVHGVAYEVDVEVLDIGDGFPPSASLPKVKPRRQDPESTVPPPAPAARGPQVPQLADGGAVTSPIAGTILELKCKPGDQVAKDQILLVIEAMKMKTSIAAPTDGRVKAVPVAVGDSVRENQVLVELA